MRPILTIAEDALMVAKYCAAHEKISLRDAMSALICAGARAHAAAPAAENTAPLRGRFALLPARNEIITVEHVRELMERGGI